MANGRNKIGKGDLGRDPGSFVAMPCSVLDCPAYGRLSYPARSLLFEIARQFVRDNNGRLLASRAYLEKRGWNSNDVITRAKKELLAAGFIFETVMGHRPNKASWYAVTWRTLDKIDGYDAGAHQLFRRSAYQDGAPITLKAKPSRDELCQRWSKPDNGATLNPSRGVEMPSIAPFHGVAPQIIALSRGAIGANIGGRPAPLAGDHLEIPSTGAKSDTTWSYVNSYCSMQRIEQYNNLSPHSSILKLN